MGKMSPRDRQKQARYFRELVRRVWVKPQFGDGCTMSPDTAIVRVKETGEFRAVSLVPCCEPHDVAYAKGGTAEDRRAADKEFHLCLRCRVGWLRSRMYYTAVRVFGGRHFG